MNDSKATNVEATYAGLIGFREKKSVVLLGGLSKVRPFHTPKVSHCHLFMSMSTFYIRRTIYRKVMIIVYLVPIIKK